MEAANTKKRKLPTKPKKTKTKPSHLMNMWFDIPDDGVLLPGIEKHLLKKQATNDRRLDCIHPSAMAHHTWCPRMEYFKLKGGVPPLETVRFQMSNVFEEGHLIHRKWQQWLQEMGNLQGMWECERCAKKWWGESPYDCPSCSSFIFKYNEVPLEFSDAMIKGHADGLTREGLIEIKSIGLGTMRFEEPELYQQYHDVNELWKNLKRPMNPHIRQANIYMHLFNLGDKHKRQVDTAIFLYEYKPTQAVKEFVIKYSPEVAEPLINKALDIANRVRDNGEAPDCYTGKSCKNCEAYETAYRRTT